MWLIENSFEAKISSFFEIKLRKPERQKKPALKKRIPITIQKCGFREISSILNNNCLR